MIKKQTKEGKKNKKHITKDKFEKDDGNYFEKVTLPTNSTLYRRTPHLYNSFSCLIA